MNQDQFRIVALIAVILMCMNTPLTGLAGFAVCVYLYVTYDFSETTEDAVKRSLKK